MHFLIHSLAGKVNKKSKHFRAWLIAFSFAMSEYSLLLPAVSGGDSKKKTES